MGNKNPGLAAVLSFLFCGLGQIYNGDVAKGLAMFIGNGILVSLGIFHWWAWFILEIGMWVWGIFNAYSSAEEMNRQAVMSEQRMREEAERQKNAPKMPSTKIPQGGFKRKVKGEIEFKNFDPL